jgi:hypothetical protein
MIGGRYLAAGVRVMMTCNPVEQASNGNDLSMPVANRLGHMAWDAPTSGEWADAMLSGEFDGVGDGKTIDAEAEEARVLEAWPAAWARARGTVASFLRKRPELLLKVPEVNSPQASKAWPSPRSWENATRALASSYVHGLPSVERDALMTAFVGEGACVELLAFLEANDLPNPEDVLDGKVKWTPNKLRLDVTDAVLSAATALVVADKTGKKRQPRAKALWKILHGLVGDAADVVYAHALALVGANLLFGEAEQIKTLAACHITIQKPLDGVK